MNFSVSPWKCHRHRNMELRHIFLSSMPNIRCQFALNHHYHVHLPPLCPGSHRHIRICHRRTHHCFRDLMNSEYRLHFRLLLNYPWMLSLWHLNHGYRWLHHIWPYCSQVWNWSDSHGPNPLHHRNFRHYCPWIQNCWFLHGKLQWLRHLHKGHCLQWTLNPWYIHENPCPDAIRRNTYIPLHLMRHNRWQMWNCLSHIPRSLNRFLHRGDLHYWNQSDSRWL